MSASHTKNGHVSSKPKVRLPRGVAAIELLMFIPIIVTFLAVTIWIVKVHSRRMQAGTEAEILAAEESVLMIGDNRLFQTEALGELEGSHDLKQLLSGFHESMQLTNGFASGLASKETGVGVRGITPPIGSVERSDYVLAHSWESTVFAFPQDKSQQRELTLPISIRGIAPIQNLEAFRSLLQF